MGKQYAVFVVRMRTPVISYQDNCSAWCFGPFTSSEEASKFARDMKDTHPFNFPEARVIMRQQHAVTKRTPEPEWVWSFDTDVE